MTVWHKTLENRFNSFTAEQQILMVCNELNRAQNNIQDNQEYQNCLERALELLDLRIRSMKGATLLKETLRARDLIAKAYLSKPAPTANLQKMLIMLEPKAWKMLNERYE